MRESEPAGWSEGAGLWSIGHSVHPLERFLGLLGRHGIEAVADVRTTPFSRFNPQFNRRAFERGLGEAGIRYLFMGVELGGRPDGDEFYDDEGHVLYGRMAEGPLFESGLAGLLDEAGRSRVAMVCSEEDPAECHRFLLIARVLYGRGVEVAHIRKDGAVQRTEEVRTFAAGSGPEWGQMPLEGSMAGSWRSVRPAPRRA